MTQRDVTALGGLCGATVWLLVICPLGILWVGRALVDDHGWNPGLAASVVVSALYVLGPICAGGGAAIGWLIGARHEDEN